MLTPGMMLFYAFSESYLYLVSGPTLLPQPLHHRVSLVTQPALFFAYLVSQKPLLDHIERANHFCLA